ncbi:unnamed protein product [Cladocopium goreaui]|uniref:Uncharacterized protein n=1 Tax=Cladocopium goreaui TaxID=2562237 RepID=A0A9P1M4Z1_9DINO|nr:unnamed protein product [Cladocopium goreaui]
MTSVAAACAKLGEHGKVAMDCIGAAAVQHGLRVARITQERHRNLLAPLKASLAFCPELLRLDSDRKNPVHITRLHMRPIDISSKTTEMEEMFAPADNSRISLLATAVKAKLETAGATRVVGTGTSSSLRMVKAQLRANDFLREEEETSLLWGLCSICEVEGKNLTSLAIDFLKGPMI